MEKQSDKPPYDKTRGSSLLGRERFDAGALGMLTRKSSLPPGGEAGAVPQE